MGNYTLTVIDTAGIQNYVFGTNNLQQISGASHLVNCATRDWVKEALSGMSHNSIDFSNTAQPFGDQRIENPNDHLDAELIYAGGGNTVLIFSEFIKAVHFTRVLTKKILKDAPGLNAFVVHQDFDWNQPIGGPNGVLQTTMQTLADRKAQGETIIPLLGRAVTAECVFTDLPAVGTDDHDRLVSAEADAKRGQRSRVFSGILGGIDLRNFEPPPFEFDQLGMTHGEKSLLAVVHIDGNGMGKRIKCLSQPYQQGGRQNRDFLLTMRAFSVSIQSAAREALQTVIDRLDAAVDPTTGKIGDHVQINDRQLPFRPIIFGGDDVTFVCDGRLGLGLATAYLDELNGKQLSDGKHLVCRAGVAIVKAHYPFARAYGLAEALCASAKREIRRIKTALDEKALNRGQEPDDLDISAVDWHIATTGLALSLEDIRLREYQVPAGRLFARPMYTYIQPASGPDKAFGSFLGSWRSWNNFLSAVNTFRTGETWVDSHNKVKALRQALRAGPEDVAHFSTLYHTQWPKLDDVPKSALDRGWVDGCCLYFDAIEMADLFIPLS